MIGVDKKIELSGLDKFGYYLSVVFSLGGTWILKTIIAKAIADSMERQA